MEEIWIECFQAGKQTDSAGNTKEWTEADLDDIIQKHNEQKPEENDLVPVVLGHPKTNDPAFGWVSTLKREGKSLFAKLRNLVPEFVESVKNKQYSNRSVALRTDNTLVHLGFLGAVPPAVKGLSPINFNADEALEVYEFANTKLIDEVKEVQKSRSLKYGINVKDNIGYLEKPTAYTNLTDEDFADPVNYLYPINDKPNLLATIRAYNHYDSTYNNIEKQVIMARIYSQAERLGINITPEYISFYSQSPNQETTKDTFDNQPKGKFNMKELITKTAEFARANYGDEIGASLFAKMLELSGEKEEPKDSFKDSAEYKEMQKKLNSYESEFKEMKFNEFFKQKLLEEKVVPSQKEILKNLFESHYGSTNTYKFAEKEVIGFELVEMLIDTFPQRKLLQTFSDGYSPSTSQEDDLSAQDEYIAKYNKSIGVI